MVSIPLKSGDEYMPDHNFITELEECYPNLDIEWAFRKMRAWCLSNPSKRKTKKGIKRFINAWLSRSETHHRLQPQQRVSTAAGDAIFGRGSADDYMDLGEAGGSIRHQVHQEDRRSAHQQDHASRMGRQAAEVRQAGSVQNSGWLDGELAAEPTGDCGKAEGEGYAQTLPLFAEAKMR